MGKTAFSGPVYGAKATLLSFTTWPGSTLVPCQVTVPSGEDWIATEIMLYRQSTGSTAFGMALLDDSTLVSSVTITSSLAAQDKTVVITSDASEYEGKVIASGSVVKLTLDSTSLANAPVVGTLRGFTRYVDSTRAV